MSTRRLLLIRHGQSEWNAQGRWQGRADPPLTELGRTQAQHAAAAVKKIPGGLDAVAGSTLERARDTARIMADGLSLAEPQLFADMIERDAGEYSGLTREQIEEQFPGNLAAQIWPPGWEPNDVLLQRVRRGITQLLGQVQGDTVACVTHGGVIYAIEDWFGIDHLRIANLGGRWLTIYPHSWRLGPRIDLLAGAERTLSDGVS